MKKRILCLLFAAVLLTVALPSLAVANDATEIKRIWMDDPGQEVGGGGGYNDVKFIYIELKNAPEQCLADIIFKNEDTGEQITTRLEKYDSSISVATLYVRVTSKMSSGKWVYYSASIHHRGGEFALDYANTNDIYFYVDNDPPEVKRVWIDNPGATYREGDTVTIYLETYDPAGIQEGSISVENEKEYSGNSAFFYSDHYNSKTGIATAKLRILSASAMKPGKWIFSECSVRDNYRNLVETAETDTGIDSSNFYFYIADPNDNSNPPSDKDENNDDNDNTYASKIKAPTIKDVYMDGRGDIFTSGDTVSVYMMVKDDYEITDAEVYFKNGSSRTAAFLDYDEDEGLVTLRLKVNDSMDAGRWYMTNASATNSEGKTGYLDDDISLYFIVNGEVDGQSDPSLDNFVQAYAYNNNFADVPYDSWYYPYVAKSYELGLINGSSVNAFNPDGTLKLSETIKIAACIHSIYYTGRADFAQTGDWYQVYVDYALQNGIISGGYHSYDADATRVQVAEIFANALPSSALPKINEIVDDSIPDVKMTDPAAQSIYKLYRAGILTGSDRLGTFHPHTSIKCSEISTIAVRMADRSFRQTIQI